MKKRPDVTQKVILRCRNKIMILRYGNGSYDFPGGRLEWGENLFDSLQRELQEEIDFKLDHQPRLFHVWNYIAKNENRHSIMVYYICDLEHKFKQLKKLMSPEGIGILWLSRKEMARVIKDQGYVKRMFAWKDPRTPYSLFYID